MRDLTAGYKQHAAWGHKNRAAIHLFRIVCLSICNMRLALGFDFVLRHPKPLVEPFAFFVEFRYLLAALATVWLVAGISAFIYFKRALTFIYLLVLVQLVVTGYEWYSTLSFLAK